MSAILDGLQLPIVGAPMAGGPSTPELAAAVSDAGGIGFLGAAYKTVAAVEEDVAAVRALTDAPFGVNVFTPGAAVPADAAALAAYAQRLAPEAARRGVELGAPRFDDDRFDGKVEALVAAAPAV